MKLQPSPPLDDFGTDWYLSDDKKVYILKWQVMFGYRIRAGYVRTLYGFCQLDICCGDSEEAYDIMLEKIKTIIEHNGPENPFKDIPRFSDIKPYFNDANFVNTIDELYQRAIQAKEHHNG
jgi:hypothetical protein